LFLEPIQGEGGVIVPPPGYLARARELCSRHGVALVLDEIQTGLGRTGRMFACEEDGVVPDLLLVGKGLGGGLFPLAACLVADGWWDERFALGHSSTFANNNVACAVGMAVLRELAGDRDRPGLVARAAARGERLGAGLRRLAARYPRVVAAARGRGLLWALELQPADEAQGLLLGYLQHQGLYAYAAAMVLAQQSSVLALPTLGTSNVLRVAPPLVVSDEQIDLIVDGIESMCGKLARNPCETVVGTWAGCGSDPDEARRRTRARPPRRRRRCRRRKPARARPPALGVPGPLHPSRGRAGDGAGPRASLRRGARAYCGHVGELPAGLCLRTPVVRSRDGRRGGRADHRAAAARRGDVAPRAPRDGPGDRPRRRSRRAARAPTWWAWAGSRAHCPIAGAAVTGRGVPITTGNALTAAAAFKAARAEAAARGLAIADARIAVLGARGSVGR
jgi:hypothetical protein